MLIVRFCKKTVLHKSNICTHFLQNSYEMKCCCFFCQQDVVVSEWPKTPDANGELVRNLSYTLSLNLAMTSKNAPTTEKQVNAKSFLRTCKHFRHQWWHLIEHYQFLSEVEIQFRLTSSAASREVKLKVRVQPNFLFSPILSLCWLICKALMDETN